MTTQFDKCSKPGTADETAPIAYNIYIWVMLREWSRVNIGQGYLSKGFDQKFSADLRMNNGRSSSALGMMSAALPDASGFVSQMDAAIKAANNLPGYDPIVCTFKWNALACMANYMASLDEATRLSALEAFVQGAQVWTCPNEVQTDPTYAGDVPKAFRPFNWKPWAIGGAVVVGLGVGGYLLFGRKHHATRPELVAST